MTLLPSTPAARSLRFHGQIAGLGTTSGTRVVVGHWDRTHLGSFSDAMVETAQGHRVLLAPTPEVAGFICDTYVFDEVRIEPVSVHTSVDRWTLEAASLALHVDLGGRTALGRLLRLVPRRVASSPVWATLVDPVARVVLRGVRTRGTALEGRREYYGAMDARRVTGVAGEFDGAALGSIAPVDPPCRFGFSSTPRTPSVTDVVTTVVLRT